ncbi:hypothetical protein [Solibaculum mannosilyticum]|nr:hypothetical protein [Solibaculum mannosilyticum]
MMQDDALRTRFFLGSNSPVGFVGRFDRLYDPLDGWRAFLIKGGPGTGKSSLMKGIAKSVGDAGIPFELVHCSSDPNSLDGVIFPSLKCCLLDATAPHVVEPKFPGACETIVNLGDHWDHAFLHKHYKEIIATSQACSALHERATRFLAAAGSLQTDTYRFALECTDTAKISRYASRLARRELGPASDQMGKESIRLLSAITPLGPIFFEETIEKLCPRLFVIQDEHGACSRFLLAQLRSYALAAGHDIISCFCSMSPHDKLDHVLIPSLGLGFVTSNSWHEPHLTPYRRIHLQRFTDTERLRLKRQRISFNRRAVRELIGEASSRMLEAKAIHDELEAFYIQAMDFKAVQQRQADLAKRILSGS